MCTKTRADQLAHRDLVVEVADEETFRQTGAFPFVNQFDRAFSDEALSSILDDMDAHVVLYPDRAEITDSIKFEAEMPKSREDVPPSFGALIGPG